MPTSRSDARNLGVPTYFTGRACKNGHIAERYVGNATCVQCARERTRQWVADNRDRYNAWSREYYKDKRHWSRESSRRWKKENPEMARAQTRKWHRENRDKVRAGIRRWRADNPNKVREHHDRRRARAIGAEGDYTAADVDRIYKSQRKKCAGCRTSIADREYHVDHIIPLAKGGTNWPNNIQLLCPRCNMSKGASMPEEWASRNGRLL